MENREQQILAEIKDMMTSIRSQLELLDAKMLELQQAVDPEGYDSEPIELDLEPEVMAVISDDLPFDNIAEPVEDGRSDVAEEPEDTPEGEVPVVEVHEAEAVEVEVPVVETEVSDEIEVPIGLQPQVNLDAETVVEPEMIEDDLPEAVEPFVEEAVTEEPVVEAEPEDDDDLPGIFDMPSVTYPAAQIAPKVKPSVADVMADKQAWRTDMPGSPVKDVRSAISLNDRIIFINHLFDEDPIMFQNTIVKINSMENLDQVVEYVSEQYPKWDMGSELVYRFMMAVRRRVK
jgi:hypothetical protein